MTLIIEDGTGKADATSFVTLDEANAYLEPILDQVWEDLDDDARERHLILGARYVSNGQIYYYSGGKEFAVQSLAWPRRYAVYRNGGPAVPEGTIPVEVRLGQITAALASANGKLPTSLSGIAAVPADQHVQTKKLDGLSITYFDPLRQSAKSGSGSTPLGLDALADLGLPAVTGIVAPLLDEAFYQEQNPNLQVPAPIVAPVWNGAAAPPIFWVGQFDEPGSFPTYLSGFYGVAPDGL